MTFQSGDVLFVPTASRLVRVEGEIKRPAIYEVGAAETFDELMSMAGGFTSSAYASQATIKRSDPLVGYPTLINVDASLGGLTFLDGDEVIIRRASEQLFSGIEVKGAVARPGVYEYIDGARISSFLSNSDRDLNVNADLEIGLIVRRVNDRLNIEILPFDVAGVIQNPNSDQDLELMPFDKIIVLPIANVNLEQLGEEGLDSDDQAEEIEVGGVEEKQLVSRRELLNPILERLRQQAGQGSPLAIVSITGAVQEPGDYPLLSSGSLRFFGSHGGRNQGWGLHR
ncbi:MAG: SLBB domain-containing protein [Candidatus Azotimanducaceae bacterium]